MNFHVEVDKHRASPIAFDQIHGDPGCAPQINAIEE